jgi:hypothetical protein
MLRTKQKPPGNTDQGLVLWVLRPFGQGHEESLAVLREPARGIPMCIFHPHQQEVGSEIFSSALLI